MSALRPYSTRFREGTNQVLWVAVDARHHARRQGRVRARSLVRSDSAQVGRHARELRAGVVARRPRDGGDRRRLPDHVPGGARRHAHRPAAPPLARPGELAVVDRRLAAPRSTRPSIGFRARRPGRRQHARHRAAAWSWTAAARTGIDDGARRPAVRRPRRRRVQRDVDVVDRGQPHHGGDAAPRRAASRHGRRRVERHGAARADREPRAPARRPTAKRTAASGCRSASRRCATRRPTPSKGRRIARRSRAACASGRACSPPASRSTARASTIPAASRSTAAGSSTRSWPAPQPLSFDFIKTYVRLPDLLQKRIIEGAHRAGHAGDVARDLSRPSPTAPTASSTSAAPAGAATRRRPASCVAATTTSSSCSRRRG